MKSIYFYDLDSTLWDTHSKEVVIDKRNPGKVLVRLSSVQSFNTKQFNKEYKLEVNYNGEARFLDPLLWKSIKKLDATISLSDIGISRREFTNKEYFDNQTKHVTIFLNVLKDLKGIDATIGILTARSKQKEHTDLINKLKETVKKELGLEITKIYFVNDKTISDPDSTSYKKCKILLEHLIGLKIKGDCFVELEQTVSNDVHFYDDQEKNIDAAININYLFLKLFHNSSDNIKNVIAKRLNTETLNLIVNKVTNNRLNPFTTTKVTLNKPYNG